MVHGELRTKIGKGKETMGVIETLLVFTMAAFYFAVVAGRVWTDQLVPDPKPCSGQLKAWVNPKFCVNPFWGANRAKFIRGGSRLVRRPPYQQNNA